MTFEASRCDDDTVDSGEALTGTRKRQRGASSLDISPFLCRADEDDGDDWNREQFTARVPRLHVPSMANCSFPAEEAAATISQGAPWRWLNFASEREVVDARLELDVLLAGQRFCTVSEAASSGRGDKVVYLDIHGPGGCPPHCLLLFQRLEAAGALLVSSAGARACWPLAGRMLCPRLGMAAVYDGSGACYEKHRDNERVGAQWMGYRQHLGTRWVNHRVLTLVAYVNPKGFLEGGSLRCYVGAGPGDQTGATARCKEDVLPDGGSAVLFAARELLHEVLPSCGRRFALTLWMVLFPDQPRNN